MSAGSVDPGAKRVAAGCADGTVKVWGASDGRLLVTLWSGGEDWLALAPEGYFATSGSLLAKGTWKAGGKPVKDAELIAPLADAAQVGRAAQGQKVAEPARK